MITLGTIFGPFGPSQSSNLSKSQNLALSSSNSIFLNWWSWILLNCKVSVHSYKKWTVLPKVCIQFPESRPTLNSFSKDCMPVRITFRTISKQTPPNHTQLGSYESQYQTHHMPKYQIVFQRGLQPRAPDANWKFAFKSWTWLLGRVVWGLLFWLILKCALFSLSSSSPTPEDYHVLTLWPICRFESYSR